jgi:hypothetical protein
VVEQSLFWQQRPQTDGAFACAQQLPSGAVQSVSLVHGVAAGCVDGSSVCGSGTSPGTGTLGVGSG